MMSDEEYDDALWEDAVDHDDLGLEEEVDDLEDEGLI